MNKLDHILAKIAKIEAICAEIKNDIEESRCDRGDKNLKKSSKSQSIQPTQEECQNEFDRLYNEYIKGNPKAVEEFVNGKSKEYLKIFCRINDLSVDTKKAAKSRLITEIQQWLAQRKAITGGIAPPN